jgi:hypothetical protein
MPNIEKTIRASLEERLDIRSNDWSSHAALLFLRAASSFFWGFIAYIVTMYAIHLSLIYLCEDRR